MVASVGTRTLFPTRVNLTLVAVLLLLAVTLPGGATAAPPSGAAGAMNGTTGMTSTTSTSPAGGMTGGVTNGVTNGSGVTTVGIDVTFLGLTITPTGTAATITFATSQPMRAGASYALAGGNGASTAATPAGVVNATIIGQAVGGGAPPVRTTATDGFTGYAATVSTRHTINLTGLKSNTLYTTNVWVTDGAGQQAQSTSITFHTPKRRIRITFPQANVLASGQSIGSPDVMWFMHVDWLGGEVAGCYPYPPIIPSGWGGTCSTIDVGPYNSSAIPFTNTHNQPVGFLFREEDFGNALPTAFTIVGAASTFSWQDILNDPLGNRTGISYSFYVWTVPQGAESSVLLESVTAENWDTDFVSSVVLKLEVFYDELSYASSTTVIDENGGKKVVTFFT